MKPWSGGWSMTFARPCRAPRERFVRNCGPDDDPVRMENFVPQGARSVAMKAAIPRVLVIAGSDSTPAHTLLFLHADYASEAAARRRAPRGPAGDELLLTPAVEPESRRTSRRLPCSAVMR